jgi:hypothetical protein
LEEGDSVVLLPSKIRTFSKSVVAPSVDAACWACTGNEAKGLSAIVARAASPERPGRILEQDILEQGILEQDICLTSTADAPMRKSCYVAFATGRHA